MVNNLTLLIIFDNEKNQIEIGGGGDSWMDLGLCIEGLGVIAQKCIDDGIDKKRVYERIGEYVSQVIAGETTVVKKQSLAEKE